MPAAIQVDKEQVRMLVLSVGVREAARQMGIAESTVQYWSMTGKWLAACKPTPAIVPLPPTMIGSTGSTKPVDALCNVLSDRHKKSRLALSKYVREASHQAAIAPDKLGISDAVANVAKIMDRVWPADHTQNLRIAIFGGDSEKPVIDI